MIRLLPCVLAICRFQSSGASACASKLVSFIRCALLCSLRANLHCKLHGHNVSSLASVTAPRFCMVFGTLALVCCLQPLCLVGDLGNDADFAFYFVRLKTRTKESNSCASLWIQIVEAKWNLRLGCVLSQITNQL